jgi:hypothetical protein
MTFKELQKLIHHRQSETNSDQIRFFNRLKDKPFWIWDVEQHKAQDIRTNGDCCFNHIIGLPIKGGQERPLYSYQKLILDTLEKEKHKHVWIKKATGLGVTELMLRYMAWLCLKDNHLQGSQMISHIKNIFSKGLVSIHPQHHDRLITQIRVAKIQENGNLDKTSSNMTFDLFDAFRLSVIRYTEDAIEVIRK